VLDVADDVGVGPPDVPLPIGGAEAIDAGCHMYDYFRVLSAMTAPDAPQQGAADVIAWDRVNGWPAPVIAEFLFPERTRGGVTVSNGRIEIDLAFGAIMRHFRRESGDFRQGAYGLLPLKTTSVNSPSPFLGSNRRAKPRWSTR
jgi:hypothetical protein